MVKVTIITFSITSIFITFFELILLINFIAIAIDKDIHILIPCNVLWITLSIRYPKVTKRASG